MVQPFRLVYGLILCAILFIPFGVYHSHSEPYIIGNLWGYNLSIGYVGLVLGLLVIFSQNIDFLKDTIFGSIMIVIGVFLLFSFLFSPKDFFINLLNGTSFSGGQFDIDYSVGNSIVWGLSLFSILTGLLLRIKRL